MWEMMPTCLPLDEFSFSNADITLFSHSWLSVPKPSSMKSVSTLMLFSARLDRPRANDNEITNPSPPESVFPERTTPSSLSSTRMTREPGCAVNS